MPTDSFQRPGLHPRPLLPGARMLNIMEASVPNLLRNDRPADARADRSPENAAILALTRLLREVAASGYRFITPTPLTHQRILARRARQVATSWRDVFGWNLPFSTALLTPSLLASMQAAGVVQQAGPLLRSGVRVASLDDDLFLHSAFPTTAEDAVFFGPDTYRFVRFIAQALEGAPGAERSGVQPWLREPGAPLRILDIGCGSGAGGIGAARALVRLGIAAERIALVMNDINPQALRFTAINAALAGLPVQTVGGDALSAVDGQFDLIISNPPYMDDGAQRAYRHGGARQGRALSVRIAMQALQRLAPGGRLLLYTGVAMVDEHDPFLEEVTPLLDGADCEWHYAEIDPDVFGEELEQPQYAQAERIAAVGLIATRRLRA